MTPANIAGMGVVAKLDIMALTDHNTCRNCPAFLTNAEENGIVGIAGMELTTAEDIHVVCLFEYLEDALAFSDAVESRRIPIKNRPEIFGKQLIVDKDEKILGEDPLLLPNATTITIDEVPAMVKGFNGICYPAHIDREANGLIATLGDFPDNSGFDWAEFHDELKIEEYTGKYCNLRNIKKIVSSDAHYLWDISGRLNWFELDCDNSAQEIRKALFKELRNE